MAGHPLGRRPTRAELDASSGSTANDLAGRGMRRLFVGINPSLWTAAVDAHFARPGNRFWPALYAAGLTDRLVYASRGLSADDRVHLLDRGIGITNLVERATARAGELSDDELRAGRNRLTAFVGTHRPRVVAIAGVTAYRTAFGRRHATTGRQAEELAGAELWVVPNPSGLNAHVTLRGLADAYTQVGRAAGLLDPAG